MQLREVFELPNLGSITPTVPILKIQHENERCLLNILCHRNHIFAKYGLSGDKHLFKIGLITRKVKIRLQHHNTDFTKVTGMVVQETGRLWEVQEVYSVQDVYEAEKLFW